MGTSFLRAETRSVLSRNRIQLPPLRVGVVGNVVRLQGALRRATGLPELTHEALEGLERELRRIPGVRRVDLHLTNWRRQDSEWRLTTAPVHAAPEPETQVLDLDAESTEPNPAERLFLPGIASPTGS